MSEYDRIKAEALGAVKIYEKPFNGDFHIAADVINLKLRFNIKTAVETGSFIYTTTKWFASQFDSVHTFELDKDVFVNYNHIVKENENTHCWHGDSGLLLKNILPSVGSDTLFFLDAHWGDYSPLLDELKQIADANIKPVIVIHDFKVPNHPYLGFDKIGDAPLSMEVIKPSLDAIYKNGGFNFHYNTTEGSAGAKRGCVFIYPKIKVFSFFEPVKEIQHYYTGLTELWMKAWNKNGFDAEILTLDDAKKHPFFNEYYCRVKDFPTFNDKYGDYEVNCYLRWLAIEERLKLCGRALAVDTDCLNISLKHDMVKFTDNAVSLAQKENAPLVSLLLTHKNIGSIINTIFNHKDTGYTIEGKPHVSDMVIFYNNLQLFESLNYETLYGNDGWETYPVIHFAGDRLRGRGEQSKMLMIKQILAENNLEI